MVSDARAHMMAREIADRTLAPLAALGERVMAWLAYEGDEAISVVWATQGPRIGVWSMMTPPAHRRKGGGRAVLTCALEALWGPETEGAFLFSTPAGRSTSRPGSRRSTTRRRGRPARATSSSR